MISKQAANAVAEKVAACALDLDHSVDHITALLLVASVAWLCIAFLF